MAAKKKTKSKSKKLKKRNLQAVNSQRTFIAKRIEKVAQIEPKTLENISDGFRSSYSKDRLVDKSVSEARSIESGFFELKALRYKDGDSEKLIITDLGIQTDADFGMVDTIGGILEKAAFADSASAKIFLVVEGEQNSRFMREKLEETDPELAARITFIRKIDRSAPAPNNQQNPANNGNQGNAAALQNAVYTAPQTNVIDSNTLTARMGEDPKSNILFIKKSDKYKKIIKKLDNYHATVAKFKTDLEQGNIKDSGKILEEKSKEMDNLVEDLVEAIDSYTTSSATKDSDQAKDVKRSVMQSLKDQVLVAQKRKLTDNIQKPVIHINRDLEVIRAEYWVKKYNPLLSSQILSNGPLLGVGAQGPVYAKKFAIQEANGQQSTFEAGIKIDSLLKVNDEATGSGIPKDNPEQSKRAVASFLLSKLLGLNVIPKTTFLMQENENGDMEFGQALAVVHGTEGQIKVRGDEFDENTVKSFAGVSDSDLGEKVEYDRVNNRAWKVENKVVNVDLTNVNIQKELSDLQLLDNILGHADRHAGNFIFETSGPDSDQILGVKGIDNDDTYGEDWKAKKSGNDKSSKTPGVPPIIDVNTALKLASFGLVFFSKFNKALSDKLTPDEVEKTMDRLLVVQNQVIERIKDGNIAAQPGTIISDAELNTLEKFANEPRNSLRARLKTWGDDTINSHSETNSYLGELVARKEEGLVTEPVYK